MFKGIVVICIIVFCISLCMPVFARNAEEVGETIVDTLSGDNGSCEMLFEPYVAKTFKDLANLPFLGKADLRAELSYQCAIDNLTEDNRVNLKVGLEY